jgi:hypothetical protein
MISEKTGKLLDAKPTRDGPIQVLFAGGLLQKGSTPGTAEQFLSAQDTLPHPSLFQQGGGDIAADPSDPKGEHPKERQFIVNVRVDNPNGHYYPGQRAYVRFQLDKKPLLWEWIRRGYQLLQTHQNDSKLV